MLRYHGMSIDIDLLLGRRALHNDAICSVGYLSAPLELLARREVHLGIIDPLHAHVATAECRTLDLIALECGLIDLQLVALRLLVVVHLGQWWTGFAGCVRESLEVNHHLAFVGIDIPDLAVVTVHEVTFRQKIALIKA